MTSPTLFARNITCELGNDRVLHNVSLAPEPGKVTGIIGANGAGKSTLLSILGGLQTHYTGEVALDACPLENLSQLERAKHIAFLPQNPEVYWDLTAQQVVALGRIPHQPQFNWFNATNETDRSAVHAAMTATRCDPFAQRPVRSLSSGEQMRVHLARMFAVNAPIMLADEPINSLDPFHQIRCLEALGARARDHQSTVIAVLHDLDLAARYCDDLLLLHEGEVLAWGDPLEVLTPANLLQAYSIRPPKNPEATGPNVSLWNCKDD